MFTDNNLIAAGALLAAIPTIVVFVMLHPRRFYRQTRWLAVDEQVQPVPAADLRTFDDDPVHADAERHGGAAVGALEDDTGVLLVGALSISGQGRARRWRAGRRRRCSCCSRGDAMDLFPNEMRGEAQRDLTAEDAARRLRAMAGNHYMQLSPS